MGIEVILVVILVVIILAKVRVKIFAYTLAFAGIVYIGARAYQGAADNGVGPTIAMLVILIVYVAVGYGIYILGKKLYRKMFKSSIEGIDEENVVGGVSPVDPLLSFSRFSKVAGVSFSNDDGGSRQDNIKKYARPGMELFLKSYEYKPGNYATAILAKEGDMSTQLGNLNADLFDDIQETDPSVEFEIRTRDVTGGTPDKPSMGVNFELLSSNKI